jgi:hypothetical protein
MHGSGKTVSDAPFEIAEEQQGYFTTKQATDTGYQLGSQANHVKAGNWIRVERGIYRLSRFPQSVENRSKPGQGRTSDRWTNPISPLPLLPAAIRR